LVQIPIFFSLSAYSTIRPPGDIRFRQYHGNHNIPENFPPSPHFSFWKNKKIYFNPFPLKEIRFFFPTLSSRGFLKFCYEPSKKAPLPSRVPALPCLQSSGSLGLFLFFKIEQALEFVETSLCSNHFRVGALGPFSSSTSLFFTSSPPPRGKILRDSPLPFPEILFRHSLAEIPPFFLSRLRMKGKSLLKRSRPRRRRGIPLFKHNFSPFFPFLRNRTPNPPRVFCGWTSPEKHATLRESLKKPAIRISTS